MHDSLCPVIRTELRAHFEQELAPLIGQRVGEMMSSFRERMGECLEGIASEHEQAAKSLGRELGPVVAEELRQVSRVVDQRRNATGGTATAISDAQFDELARTVEIEVVQPLHARIQDLSAQVRRLQEEARQLERRWSQCNMVCPSPDGVARPPGLFAVEMGVPGVSVADRENAESKDLERTFHEGKAEEAFVKAMQLQTSSKHTDFLGRLCNLIPGSIDTWLNSPGSSGRQPLSMPVKMLLMLSLSQQMQTTDILEEVRSKKIEWISELWYAFEPADPLVVSNSANMCSQLLTTSKECLLETVTPPT